MRPPPILFTSIKTNKNSTANTPAPSVIVTKYYKFWCQMEQLHIVKCRRNTAKKKLILLDNTNFIIRQYKAYTNKLTYLKEISKQNDYKQAFKKCHHDTKKTWKLVNEIIAIKNKSQQNNKLFEDSACQKQCEDLNSFFSEVGKSLSTNIKPPPTTYRHFITHINPKNSLFLAPTDAYEIQHTHQKP